MIDPAQLLALGYNRIEVRTAFTNPVLIDLNQPASPQDEALLREVQPAITLSGLAGRIEIAPYGIPSGISPRVRSAAIAIGLGLGAALIGVMIFGGLLFSPPKKRRLRPT